ncbi:cytochrome P450 monooxygenase [Leptodontidium sp. 2 PMI_412]|nr:cytochrome P450 monooxygenase [Leptodontidium sp. 2 PMI_412]
MTTPSLLQSTITASTLLAGFGILYTFALVIWRLYFSPISHFPGPRLAALTYWYEFYYDLIQRGRFLYKIQELHDQYGPIIRINPHELHVSDPDFYHTIYAGGSSKRNRDPYHTATVTLPGSLLTSPPHDLHRKRRAALNPFFSQQSARRLLPLLQERIDVLVAKLEELKDTGKVVNLLHAFSAFSNDVISQYLFGTSEHRLEAEDFDPSYHTKILGAAGSTVVVKHFPIIPSIIDNLPEFVTDHVGALADQKKMKKVCLIENVRNKGAKSTTTETTIFHTLLESDLPPSEKTTTRLTEEGITLVGAGSHTVAWALTVGCFHVLSNPYILSTLKSELATINRDDGEALNSVLSQLEKLPFLTGIIKESLRLSYGTSLRLPRIDPEKPMQFHEWSIPPGTAVSMTGALMHHDESIFPDSKEFKPERWVENKGLDRYLTSFSAGSRACLGITLAWAELYLGFAGVFGKIGGVGEKGERGVMRLVGTDRSDVDIVGDAFFPLVREGSEGVRVLITS